MSDERQADVRAIAVEHPGAGADHRLRRLEVAEFLDALAGHDRDCHRIGQHVEEPAERLLEAELDGVSVQRLDALDRLQHVGRRVALEREEPFDRVADVVRRELAPVDGRLGVPPHAPAELEDVGRLGRLAPGLGQVALDRERRRRDRRSGLVAKQPTVREGDGDLDPVGRAQHRVEERRIPRADRHRAAATGGLRPDAGRRDDRPPERKAAQPQQLASLQSVPRPHLAVATPAPPAAVASAFLKSSSVIP